MSEYLTWATLGTSAGALLGVTIITKGINFVTGGHFKGNAARILSLIVSITIVVTAGVVTGTVNSWATCVLALINSVIVMLSANGAYDAVHDNKGST